MASIAQQVVFHPAVSQSLKLWSTTLGRDKVRISGFILPSRTPVSRRST